MKNDKIMLSSLKLKKWISKSSDLTLPQIWLIISLQENYRGPPWYQKSGTTENVSMTGATGIVSVPNLLTFLLIFMFSHLKIIGKKFFYSLQYIFTWAHICTCMYSIWHWPMLQQFMEKRSKIHLLKHQSQCNMTPLFWY